MMRGKGEREMKAYGRWLIIAEEVRAGMSVMHSKPGLILTLMSSFLKQDYELYICMHVYVSYNLLYYILHKSLFYKLYMHLCNIYVYVYSRYICKIKINIFRGLSWQMKQKKNPYYLGAHNLHEKMYTKSTNMR